MTFPAPYRARPAGRATSSAWSRSLRPVIRPTSSSSTSLRDEIVADWAAARFDFERDTVVAETPDGAIAGYGLVLAHDATVQIFAMGTVHPEHAGRGLGIGADPRERTTRCSPASCRRERPFRSYMPAADAAARQLFVEHGYRVVRSFWHMQRGLPADDAPVVVPDGITMRLGRPDGDEAIAYRISTRRSATISATSCDQEEWLQEFQGMPGYDPSLIVLAFEGEEPVGASVNLAADDGVGWSATSACAKPGGAEARAGRCSPDRSRSSPHAGTTRCGWAWTPRTRRARPTCTRGSA